MRDLFVWVTHTNFKNPFATLGYNHSREPMAENCIFCKIVSRTVSGDIVYQDDQVTAFRDQHPAAPIHVLIVPNRHIASLNDCSDQDQALWGHILWVASKIAAQEGVSQSGYRVMINNGADAGQTVFHVHVHLMGGQRLPGFVR